VTTSEAGLEDWDCKVGAYVVDVDYWVAILVSVLRVCEAIMPIP
jgi:hypothetical protein